MTMRPFAQMMGLPLLWAAAQALDAEVFALFKRATAA
jgi:hypothetical protein